MASVTLADVARALDLPIPPDGDRPVTGMAALGDAGRGDLTMVNSEAYAKAFQTTAAMAVIVQRKVELPTTSKAVFRVDDTEAAVAKVLQLFAPPSQRPAPGIDTTARLAASATLGPDAALGPNVVIGHRTTIGRGAALHAGVIIGDDVTIGDDCELHANVVLRERITIGNRVVIHAGSVIGSDGFGYRWDGQRHAKVPQIGSVVIEDDVEIGSCVCVDRAKFGATRVGRGTKIDNLVQVGHNVQIGEHCIIVAQTGIAGSARLGIGVVVGGQTAIRDHITVGDGAMAAARSALVNDVPPKQLVSGMPALPHRQSLREQAALRRLPELIVQVRQLQEEIEQLKKKG